VTHAKYRHQASNDSNRIQGIPDRGKLVGKGRRAAIFAPGSTRALADSPSKLKKNRTEEIVAEAQRIIDARLGPRSL
jgi:hypothetical protein